MRNVSVSLPESYAQKGLDIFDERYKNSDTIDNCEAVLVRSAKMHDMELPESVAVIARAGAV